MNCSSKETQWVICGATNRETEEQSENAASSVPRPKRSDHVHLSSNLTANKAKNETQTDLMRFVGQDVFGGLSPERPTSKKYHTKPRRWSQISDSVKLGTKEKRNIELTVFSQRRPSKVTLEQKMAN